MSGRGIMLAKHAKGKVVNRILFWSVRVTFVIGGNINQIDK